jgi:hypothetical protein
VDEYDEKEIMLHSLFGKSRLQNSELFAVDVALVIQLLTSFEGRQVYPEDTTKAEVFAEATESVGVSLIPDGVYDLKENRRGFGIVTAKMKVANGKFIVLKGSVCAPVTGGWAPAVRRAAIIENNVYWKMSNVIHLLLLDGFLWEKQTMVGWCGRQHLENRLIHSEHRKIAENRLATSYGSGDCKIAPSVGKGCHTERNNKMVTVTIENNEFIFHGTFDCGYAGLYHDDQIFF